MAQAVAAPVPSAVDADATISRGQKSAIFGIVNASHAFNHANSSMMAVLYQPISRELGFGPFEIGVLQTTYQIASQGFQVAYGVLTQYFKRSVLLGVGNIILGTLAALAAFVTGYWQLLLLRVGSAAGSSPQHPVGSAILVSYFTHAKGTMLTMHNAAGNVGGLIAPLLAAYLLTVVGWRGAFLIISIPSIIMGLTYFFFRDVVRPSGGDKRTRAKATWEQYKAVLRNRNIMLVSLILMVGAAGRGTGIDVAFLVPFFVWTLGLPDTEAGLQIAAGLLTVMNFAALVGPFVVAYFFDRYNQRVVLAVTLVLSSVATLWLLAQHEIGPALFINLMLYGSMLYARGTMTQAMVAEAAKPDELDTAFSLFFFIGFISGPFWTLVTGALIAAFRDTEWGFTPAFIVVGCTYVAGTLLVAFVKPEPKPAAVA
jgi:MFS family permease